MAKIVLENIQQYEQIFGREKMRTLWAEFVSDAAAKLDKIEERDYEAQRLAYHSLRSSSQVFGMMEFSCLCEEREEEILAGMPVNADKAEDSRQLLKISMAEVEAYLN